MEFKKSNYNLFVPYGERTIVYNMMSGNIGTFDKDTMERYENGSLSNSEIEYLLHKQILVDKSFEEINKINRDRYDSISNPKYKNFRIWPTSSCNARCYYCFEKGISFISMSKNVADATIRFINKNINEGEFFNVEWFGGEPLLGIDIIDYIVNQINQICQKKNCKVRYTMISNGSLIDPHVAQQLKEWNIKSIQITLDGYEDDYNRIKSYVDSEHYNFKRVIEGINLLNNKGIFVGIRMNYDVNNYKSLKKLIAYLHEKFIDKTNIRYYVYPVWSSLIENDDTFISTTEADKMYMDLLKDLVSYNMNDIRQVARLGYRRSQCHACHECGFTIFPDGKIGKCDETFTQTVGDVWNGITNNDVYKYWTSFELDEYCKNCIYLPMCQGGCRASHYTKMPQCFAHKKIVNELLVWYIDYLDEKRNKEHI